MIQNSAARPHRLGKREAARLKAATDARDAVEQEAIEAKHELAAAFAALPSRERARLVRAARAVWHLTIDYIFAELERFSVARSVYRR